MKKVILIILSIIIIISGCFYGLYKVVSSGGVRSGDVFQETPLKSICLNYGIALELEPLVDIIDCDEEISLQVFWDKTENKILCASFEKKGGKFAYIYDFSFALDEIDDKLGVLAFDVYKGSDVIYSIMPGQKKGIIINNNIEATVVPFEFNGITYKCWYSIVEGGSDAVISVEYAH